MHLTDIKGLGPAKVARLEAAGVSSVRELAELDLRVHRDLPIGREVLQRAKREARRMLASQGEEFYKASYGDRRPDRKARFEKVKEPKGLWARILRR